MRILPLRLFVMTIKGLDPRGLPISEDDKAQALERLKKMTGKDFGFDGNKWDEWCRANKLNEYDP